MLGGEIRDTRRASLSELGRYRIQDTETAFPVREHILYLTAKPRYSAKNREDADILPCVVWVGYQ